MTGRASAHSTNAASSSLNGSPSRCTAWPSPGRTARRAPSRSASTSQTASKPGLCPPETASFGKVVAASSSSGISAAPRVALHHQQPCALEQILREPARGACVSRPGRGSRAGTPPGPAGPAPSAARRRRAASSAAGSPRAHAASPAARPPSASGAAPAAAPPRAARSRRRTSGRRGASRARGTRRARPPRRRSRPGRSRAPAGTRAGSGPTSSKRSSQRPLRRPGGVAVDDAAVDEEDAGAGHGADRRAATNSC